MTMQPMTPQQQQSASSESKKLAALKNRLRKLTTLRRSGIQPSEIFTTRQAAQLWKTATTSATYLLDGLESDGLVSGDQYVFHDLRGRLWWIRSKKR